jgi:hypothetical protein
VLTAKVRQGVDRIGGASPNEINVAGAEPWVSRYRGLAHRQPVAARRCWGRLQRLGIRWDEKDDVEAEVVVNLGRGREVADVDGIESAAENADPGHDQ